VNVVNDDDEKNEVVKNCIFVAIKLKLKYHHIKPEKKTKQFKMFFSLSCMKKGMKIMKHKKTQKPTHRKDI
jgi:hypothetical protein